MAYRNMPLVLPLEEKLRQTEAALKEMTIERDCLRDRARSARWVRWQRRLGIGIGVLAGEGALYLLCCAFATVPGEKHAGFTVNHPWLALWFGLATLAAGAIYLAATADD